MKVLNIDSDEQIWCIFDDNGKIRFGIFPLKAMLWVPIRIASVRQF